jgi:hypothetical protein
LLPLVYPDWKILTTILEENSRRSKGDSGASSIPKPKPLTAKALVGVCGDPELDFVIAKEDVGFDPLRHTHPGSFKNWNLYDCRRVRSEVPAA